MDIKKIFFTIGILFSLLFGIVLFFVYRSAESCDKMVNNWWEVKKIVVNKEDVTKDYKNLNFLISYSKRNPISLPFNKTEKAKNTNKENNWDYYRSGWFDGNIIISDNRQGIFTGDYQIEILDNRTPKLVKLYSDNIALYLYQQTLTGNSPTKINW